ncbi:hypothetical protein Pcinc_038184 [Petrolisthes cinctipes]|uniref:Secreted protein n=1 Tax=Petrolisthes cinctipes TaxID=88211 RepID=A0AAE1BV08_PETCI|nr:hypothetical protein Pcinc_038184 [Petrolisthes cinctipes]
MPGSAPPLLLLVTAALLPLIGVAGGCVPEQLVQGCRLEEGACVCGLGCNTTFRYATRDQCQAALKVSAHAHHTLLTYFYHYAHAPNTLFT